jgi:integrase
MDDIFGTEESNHSASRGLFDEYFTGKSENTRRNFDNSLRAFGNFIRNRGLMEVGNLSSDPNAWQEVTGALVKDFRRWLLERGDAVSSVQQHLYHIKALAKEAGSISPEEITRIEGVKSHFSKDEKRIIDSRRSETRRGAKKKFPVKLTTEQAFQLKEQPDTAQGRRDAVMMCLLLDQGLKAGELEKLEVEDVDLKNLKIHILGKKESNLTEDTASALNAWFDSGNALKRGPLLRASRKGGRLGAPGMSKRAITGRVRSLGQAIGLTGLSADDCYHFWMVVED